MNKVEGDLREGKRDKEIRESAKETGTTEKQI